MAAAQAAGKLINVMNCSRPNQADAANRWPAYCLASLYESTFYCNSRSLSPAVADLILV